MVEWMAYCNIDPFGGERLDLHAGIVASTIANVNRKKSAKPYTARDFMPDWRSQDERVAHDMAEQQMKREFQKAMSTALATKKAR